MVRKYTRKIRRNKRHTYRRGGGLLDTVKTIFKKKPEEPQMVTRTLRQPGQLRPNLNSSNKARNTRVTGTQSALEAYGTQKVKATQLALEGYRSPRMPLAPGKRNIRQLSNITGVVNNSEEPTSRPPNSRRASNVSDPGSARPSVASLLEIGVSNNNYKWDLHEYRKLQGLNNRQSRPSRVLTPNEEAAISGF